MCAKFPSNLFTIVVLCVCVCFQMCNAIIFGYDLLLLIAVSHALLFCLWKHKMAMNVSLDSNNPDDKCSRYEVLSWINETLQTHFTQVEQCRSGTVSILFC